MIGGNFQDLDQMHRIGIAHAIRISRFNLSDQIRGEFDSMSGCVASRRPVATGSTTGDAGARARASWNRRVEWLDDGERCKAIADVAKRRCGTDGRESCASADYRVKRGAYCECSIRASRMHAYVPVRADARKSMLDTARRPRKTLGTPARSASAGHA
ncbi:hypothetical protein [Burkholderia oklahomensis]|uniref:hypothetical protein n=1 Tax=Burkholderia oklahomensis TaxID=342113 RepID=UPI000F534FE1|nr:hypothetical protein [Burkholderia oklahomensis]MBI0359453.1 hypothetical protein [Burkholderia oklahomensis]